MTWADDWEPDEDDGYEMDDEGDQPPLLGCACENALLITRICAACLAWMQEVEREALQSWQREVQARAATGQECGAEVLNMVRAKFRCVANEGGNIELHAVHADSPENEAFFSATPNGQIRLQVVNPPAAAAFVVGQQYFVDFTEWNGAAIGAPGPESPTDTP